MITIRRFALAWATAALAVACSTADACESWQVETLPFPAVADVPVKVVPFLQLSREAGGPTFGAMRAEIDASMDPKACVIRIGYRNPVIVVAAEVAANECTKAHVLAHEYQHVANRVNALQRWPREIAAKAAEIGARDAVLAAVARVEAEDHALDSPAEYAANLTACGGAIPRSLNRADVLALQG